MVIEAHAYAKLNISLDVISKLDSGYHDMRMVMETVELCDDISIAVTQGQGIHLSTNLNFLPSDDRNIAFQAARLFFQKCGLEEKQVQIKINKRIPVCAGMAGGSTDAAAVLRGLNTLMGTGLTRQELELMGGELGSDVPYCVSGGTVLAEGRGDRLRRLNDMPPCHIVICKPKFSVSTPVLFGRIDCGRLRHRPDTTGIIEALNQGQLDEVSHRMYNVFEDVLDERHKEVCAIKSSLLDCGALGAAMTGTGPSVFALFDDERLARRAYAKLSKTYRETFLTKNRKAIEV